MDLPPLAESTSRQRRRPLTRIYKLLLSRLSTPLLTSILLVPFLPAGNHNAIFALVPFYKSLRVLLASSHRASNTSSKHRRNLQQWLSYWTLYAFVRFLEATRCNISTSQQRWTALHNALDMLPRLLREKIANFLMSRRSKNALNETATIVTKDMTLATQLAGSPARWTVIKALLLFYAMDEELQGARWITEKIVKPFFGFFTSLDEDEIEDETLLDNEEKLYLHPHSHQARRTIHTQHDNILSPNLQDEPDAHATEEQQQPTPGTPELSMDGSSGGSDNTEVWHEENTRNDSRSSDSNTRTIQLKNSEDVAVRNSATWPVETITVEGNHWVQ